MARLYILPISDSSISILVLRCIANFCVRASISHWLELHYYCKVRKHDECVSVVCVLVRSSLVSSVAVLTCERCSFFVLRNLTCVLICEQAYAYFISLVVCLYARTQAPQAVTPCQPRLSPLLLDRRPIGTSPKSLRACSTCLARCDATSSTFFFHSRSSPHFWFPFSAPATLFVEVSPVPPRVISSPKYSSKTTGPFQIMFFSFLSCFICICPDTQPFCMSTWCSSRQNNKVLRCVPHRLLGTSGRSRQTVLL